MNTTTIAHPTDLEQWDQVEADYLAAHPEIRASVPTWAETIDIEAIDDELEGTIFSFLTRQGEVELYGCGRLTNGVVRISGEQTPNLYLPNEVEVSSGDDLRTIARDLLAMADIFDGTSEAGR
ncbi:MULTISPECIES: hypothetical protein [unclassified Microbacterium]|uniref:hypothetical protein n=1 Tax=unclassified Microbacterium TaxID=2609290 RepID=UPI000C2CB2C8|nr:MULTISPECIES: hypothetical protein [unclassified Microbacterium]